MRVYIYIYRFWKTLLFIENDLLNGGCSISFHLSPSPSQGLQHLCRLSTIFHWVPPAQATASDNQRCRSTCTWNPHPVMARHLLVERRNCVPSNMYNIHIYICIRMEYGALFFPGVLKYWYIYICMYIYIYVYVNKERERERGRIYIIVTLVRIVRQCVPVHYYISIK